MVPSLVTLTWQPPAAAALQLADGLFIVTLGEGEPSASQPSSSASRGLLAPVQLTMPPGAGAMLGGDEVQYDWWVGNCARAPAHPPTGALGPDAGPARCVPGLLCCCRPAGIPRVQCAGLLCVCAAAAALQAAPG